MIGFYVHHHGRGHLSRTTAILANLHVPATVLTSGPAAEVLAGEVPVVQLPLDLHDGPSPEGLHYAPLGSRGLRRRMADIAAWAEREGPRLLVVDVSVEVALLGRLLGLPVVVVRQHGDRRDAAHALGYAMAVSLLAPYPESLEDPTATPELRARTCYAGLFSRFDDRDVPRDAARRHLGLQPEDRCVVVMNGAAGQGSTAAMVQAAADANPGWRWLLLGGEASDHAVASGWADDPYLHLRAADVVVTSGGHNSIAEVVAADRPLICIPQDRPFAEQHAKAAALQRAGAAVVVPRWPGGSAWAGLLDAALRLAPAPRQALLDGKGARRAAAHLEDLAETYAG